MNILLVGYGKMGKTIEALAQRRGHNISGRVDIGSADKITGDADVAIEFTQPESAVENMVKCFREGLPVVCGTTGWLKRLDEVKQLCTRANGALFYASNFSPGVNVFFRLNEYLARLINGQKGYDVNITEIHHTQKKDAPSGTAISLAEGIIQHLNTKKVWTDHETQNPGAILITSRREDPAPGTHIVKYHSTIDDMEIKHTAHSREGFALGAVLAAEWLKGRRGVFTMDDLLKF